MYPSYAQPTALSLFFARIAYFLRCLSPFHGMKGTVVPNDFHLEHHRRVFRAPSTAAEKFSRMLLADTDFAKALPQNNGEYLIQFGICGDQLRANLYSIEGDPSLVRVYDGDWANNGVFSYLLMPNREVTQVLREMPGRFYHPTDVRLSYSRPLSTEELMEVDAMRVHSL
jgi:hypothetical protein